MRFLFGSLSCVWLAITISQDFQCTRIHISHLQKTLSSSRWISLNLKIWNNFIMKLGFHDFFQKNFPHSLKYGRSVFLGERILYHHVPFQPWCWTKYRRNLQILKCFLFFSGSFSMLLFEACNLSESPTRICSLRDGPGSCRVQHKFPATFQSKFDHFLVKTWSEKAIKFN